MTTVKTNPDNVEALCHKIEMPAVVTAEITGYIKNRDFDAALFNGLFSLETGEDAVRDVEKRHKADANGFGSLAVYMAAALRTRDIYERKGIPESIYTDTIKVFSRFVREHMDSYGTYGFDRDFWMYRCLSASLFRLGTLEFEMYLHEDGIDGYADIGDPVLSVHIPSDAVMTRESLDASYAGAKEFFTRFFPDFAYKCVYCDTWMLSPVLKDMLPPTSRILLFSSDYKIISRNEDDREYLNWVFKKEYDDLNMLPEDTSLRRNIKKHVLAGGKVGNALGVLRDKFN